MLITSRVVVYARFVLKSEAVMIWRTKQGSCIQHAVHRCYSMHNSKIYGGYGCLNLFWFTYGVAVWHRYLKADRLMGDAVASVADATFTSSVNSLRRTKHVTTLLAQYIARIAVIYISFNYVLVPILDHSGAI